MGQIRANPGRTKMGWPRSDLALAGAASGRADEQGPPVSGWIGRSGKGRRGPFDLARIDGSQALNHLPR
jgi:hypothetical protein